MVIQPLSIRLIKPNYCIELIWLPQACAQDKRTPRRSANLVKLGVAKNCGAKILQTQPSKEDKARNPDTNANPAVTNSYLAGHLK